MKAYNHSYFQDDDFLREYIILKVLSGSKVPLGSWILKEKLGDYELDLSIASVGRLLRELDNKGFTRLVKNQGRLITEKGMNYFTTVNQDMARFNIEREVIEASNPNSPKQFLELIHARKIIEIETARLAAIHATEEDIEKLENSIQTHSDHISHHEEDSPKVGCNFHELIGQASHNRFLWSVLKLLIHEEMELEEKFPYPATSIQGLHYIQDHQDILKAIKERNEEQVTILMEKHMNKLIEEIEIYFKEGNGIKSK